jgi:hypothetical protein
MELKLPPSGDCAALDISKGRSRATARIKVCTRWRCIFNVNVEMKMNVTLESAQKELRKSACTDQGSLLQKFYFHSQESIMKLS